MTLIYMLTKKRKISEVEEFKKDKLSVSCKELCLQYNIPYQFLYKYKHDENKMIKFLLKVLKYRETGLSNDHEVIEANKYYSTYFL